jgi:hypothetical protein
VTATELIKQLEDILAQRDGEDIEVRLNINFYQHSNIQDVLLLDENEPNVVMLCSLECFQAIEQYGVGVRCPENVCLN